MLSGMNVFKRTVLAALAAASFLPCALHSQMEEVKAKVDAALTAAEQGRNEEAYRIWMELMALGTSGLGEEGLPFVRSQVYQAAMMKIAEIGDGNCAKTLEWVEKGKKPGPPEYKHTSDVLYPGLLIAEGVCYAQQGKYESAYAILWQSKLELRKASPEHAAEFLRNADQYLAAVNKYVISEGDYVTNKGVLQAWIGKVISRSGDSLEVRITYVNKDLAAGFIKGSPAGFSVSECKELGTISADAAIKGWRE